jgi:cytochrome c-type biogenesis protein CcmE
MRNETTQAPPRLRRASRIGVTALVLTGALSLPFYASLTEGTEYYKHVDEVMTDPASWYGKRLQLHGFVVDGSILRRRDSLDYRFQIESHGKSVSARYTGVVPDNFKSGAELVVKSRLGPDGFVVERDGIMAKCPSKYEGSR